MSKKSKTTTTPTNPEWVTSGIQGLMGQVSDLGKRDPYSFVAGSNPLLEQARTNLLGTGVPGEMTDYQQARQFVMDGAGGGGSVQGASLLDGLDKYMSPYTKGVVESALADFDYGAGQTRAQQDLNIARDAAFGGSGAALTRSTTEGSLARARATTSAGLYDQAFNTGATLSGQDADRRQAASIANAQLAEQAASRRLQAGTALAGISNANIGQLSSVGDYFRQMEQQRLQAPISLLTSQAGVASQLPLQLFQGNIQKTKTSDPLGAIATLAPIALAPFTGGASLGFGAGLKGASAAKGLLGGSSGGGSILPIEHA